MQIATNPARLDKLRPFEALSADLSGKAPNFAFIVPNQCHDGHGLPMCRDPDRLTRDYDAFVEQTVGLIRAWNSAIVVTFDEESRRPARRALPLMSIVGVPTPAAPLSETITSRP